MFTKCLCVTKLLKVVLSGFYSHYMLRGDLFSKVAAFFLDLNYFMSARPKTEHAVIKITLKETAELALHSSVSQQPTAHSPSSLSASSHVFFNFSQASLVLHKLVTDVTSSFLVQVLIQTMS